MILTDEEVIETFGDPLPFIRDDRHVSSEWERQILTPVTLPGLIPLSWRPELKVGLVRCHVKIALPVRAVFTALHDKGLWPLLKDYGGCYAWRANVNNPLQLSRHCWGIAFDINVRDNLNHGPPRQSPDLVAEFERHGFAWLYADPMHFEYVG